MTKRLLNFSFGIILNADSLRIQSLFPYVFGKYLQPSGAEQFFQSDFYDFVGACNFEMQSSMAFLELKTRIKKNPMKVLSLYEERETSFGKPYKVDNGQNWPLK